MKSKIISLPKITDPRGNLSVIEKDIIPFTIKRTYFLYDVPSGSKRGGHAHKAQESVVVALSGSFDVILNDGKERKIFTLNKPNEALYIQKGTWREIENFSAGAVCLVVSSGVYDEEDYIRNFEEFLEKYK